MPANAFTKLSCPCPSSPVTPNISPFGKLKFMTSPFSQTFKSLDLRTISSEIDFGGVDFISEAVEIFLSPVIRPSKFFSVISSPARTPTSTPSLITVARSLILTSSAIL